jgi:hypothetical protein
VHQGSTVPAACPRCDQALAVPGYDLSSAIRCPRCRSVLALADIVSRRTPLVPAITLSSATPVDDNATLKDLPVVFADGTRPKTDDVDAKPPASAIAAVLPGRVPVWKKHPFARRLPLAEPPSAKVKPAPRIVRRAADLLMRVERALRPHRLAWFLGASAFATAGQYLDLALGAAPAIGIVSATMFLAFVSVMVLAHVASIREDDGTFAWSSVRRRARAFRRALEADAKHFTASPRLQKRTLVAKAFLVWGFVSLAAIESANLVRAMAVVMFDASEPAHDLEAHLAAGALSLAALGAVALHFVRRSTKRLDASDPDDDLQPMFRARAAVLDRGDTARALSRFSGRAKEIVGTVIAWRPRVGSSGREYATDLARHLRRHVGSVSIDANPIFQEARGITSGLIVGGSLLVLVRRAAHLDPLRALRAIHRARAVWAGKPVLVVFVEHPQNLLAKGPGGAVEPVEKLVARTLATIDGEPRVVGVWL